VCLIGGGDINHSFKIENSEHVYFVKLNSQKYLSMFNAEKKGLLEIKESNSIQVPKVITTGDASGFSFIILEYLEFLNNGSWKVAGEQLARMHKSTNKQFGWNTNNTIGLTPQINSYSQDWIAFFIEFRINFQIKLAKKNGLNLKYTADLFKKTKSLFLDYHPVPSLLHGDLWSGNISFNSKREPVIYDPAVYYGDRETDIAMTELFGRFPDEFYEGYNEIYKIDYGYEMRKNLYHLYHILNHYNIFGGSYGDQSQKIIMNFLS
jgi:fructosamine-3-kinase